MRKIEEFFKAEVINNIPNEVPKDDVKSCFPGAWYRKAVSSKDDWLGLEGVVTLPEFMPDEERFTIVADHVYPGEMIKTYKDTPSVYVGGSSDYENDIGFGWFRGIEDSKTKRVSSSKITFRPFWRYIFLDENGMEKNIYAMTKLEEVQYYFFPGDKVKITIGCLEDNFLQFRIDLIEPTNIKKYIDIRNKLNLPNNLPSSLVVDKIPAPGVGIRKTEYKRVNAIDQYGNEGKPSQMTKAFTLPSIWHEVYLFRLLDGEIVKVPFNESRYTSMCCPVNEAFEISNKNDTLGSECIAIKPII